VPAGSPLLRFAQSTSGFRLVGLQAAPSMHVQGLASKYWLALPQVRFACAVERAVLTTEPGVERDRPRFFV